MGGPHIDALKISPKFNSDDWYALNRAEADHWLRAARIVKDRLNGRFLRYAGNCLRSEYSGFVVLSIDSRLLETLQQFKEGIVHGHGQSRRLIKACLAGPRFQPDFDEAAREAYWLDIRCGLLHQAEARNMWLVRRGEPRMLRTTPGGGFVIDVKLFHRAVRESLNDYLREIARPDNGELRDNLWTKMDAICNVRVQRGVEYAVGRVP